MKEMRNLIIAHLEKRPHMEIKDIYKLIYQSVLGLGHLIDDHHAARNNLRNELDNVRDNGFQEDLIEDISINNSMVRINLRPFKERDFQWEILFDAMIKTEEENTAKLEDFIEIWKTFIQMAEEKSFDISIEELNSFNEEIITKNYPVMHHSTLYNQTYRPAYRIVDRGIFENMFKL